MNRDLIMKKRYVRVTGPFKCDGNRAALFLEVVSDSPNSLLMSGYEVSKDGSRVPGKESDQILHILEKRLFKIVEYRMSRKYGELLRLNTTELQKENNEQ